jgi:hypothetical protein
VKMSCIAGRRLILSNTTAVFVVICPPIYAQVPLWKVTKAGHEVVIEGYARTNAKCEPIDPPALSLDQPATHGVVCWRPGTVWLRKVEEGNLAQCLRHVVRGIHVVYLPRGGYTGSDTVAYTVRFPGIDHPVRFDVTIEPDMAHSPTSVPADISTPADENLQSSGPIPACTALTS